MKKNEQCCRIYLLELDHFEVLTGHQPIKVYLNKIELRYDRKSENATNNREDKRLQLGGKVLSWC
ncbi:hypothetical protein TCAL_16319 [Tigriopus californicus]|uniref:Uncharacterized protein n=1 Tax=Tigriopus californicus TaxID=6832 RepID=A0A553N7L1_TIGCA|nr:hypothetical protein TCAL_16319 [Tigriopus californicus]